MLNKINVLREKLEKQFLEDESYDKILATSREIDELLVKYYKEIAIEENTNSILVK